ncbi:bifunctional DNA primase/polymerase [Mesorhizobium sp. BR1-1-3]|uniref:bifunctional DNA primase/polymerase n=1 Tax=Mesorhizobium sp. BR1-1-3 TaxID=2876651 RepID=UPI001CD09C7D|nr:bifunctional DNA primase/polymerase [Mesorhizobium sp. BR1-1-3]MBZ9888961.1 bifunctional DNA primase/polymerase [Mesorhizobium sp. BR1-1-3]
MSGVFAEWQPRYAEHNVATFPVTDSKVPAVKGYLRVGLNASEQLAMRFPDNDAIGIACRRNRITVLDVDTPDERVLADALSRHGQTPFIVRSGSGNHQAWYRRTNETRRVRPDPEKPIDILGDGFVVAPPSRGAKGQYTIIQGTLDDLETLPTMKAGVSNALDISPKLIVPRAAQMSPMGDRSQGRGLAEKSNAFDPEPQDIKRNDTLWRHCMKAARSCPNFKGLMEVAVDYNSSEFYTPLPADEVLKIVASAWDYECKGKNLFGLGPRLVLDVDIVDELAASAPDAFALLGILRRHHAGSESFFLARAMADSMKWDVRKFLAARDLLLARSLIECIHPGGRGRNDPPVYRFPL